MLYTDVKPIVKHIQKYIKGLYASGSYRRKEDNVNDLDFITKRNLDEVIDDFKNMYETEIIKQGDDYAQIKLDLDEGPLNIDIWRANDDYEYNFLKWMRDFDKGHNIYYRKLAKDNGYTLSDRGLKKGDKYIHIGKKSNLKKALTIWKFEKPVILNENNIRL